MSNINVNPVKHHFPEIMGPDPMYDVVTTPESFGVMDKLDEAIRDALMHMSSDNNALSNVLLNYVMKDGWAGPLVRSFRMLMGWKMTYDLDVCRATHPELYGQWANQGTINNTIVSVFQCYALGKISSFEASEEDWNEFANLVGESDLNDSRNPSLQPSQYTSVMINNRIDTWKRMYNSQNPEGEPQSQYELEYCAFLDARKSAKQQWEDNEQLKFETSGYNTEPMSAALTPRMSTEYHPTGDYYGDSTVHAETDPLSRNRARARPVVAPRVPVAEEEVVAPVVEEEPVINIPTPQQDVPVAVADYSGRSADDVLAVDDVYPKSLGSVASYLWEAIGPDQPVSTPQGLNAWTEDDMDANIKTTQDEDGTWMILSKEPDTILKSAYGRWFTMATPCGAFVNNFTVELDDDRWLVGQPVKIFNGVTMRDYNDDIDYLTVINENRTSYGSLIKYTATMKTLEAELSELVKAGEQTSPEFYTKRDEYYRTIHEFETLRFNTNSGEMLQPTTRPYGLRRAMSQTELAREYFGKFWMEDIDWRLLEVNGMITIVYSIMDSNVAEVLHGQLHNQSNGQLDRDRNGNYIGFSPTEGMYLAIKQEYRGDAVYRTYIERIYMDDFDFSTMEEAIKEKPKAKQLAGKEVDKNTDTYYRCTKRVELEQELAINKDEQTLLLVSKDACVTGFNVTENEYDFMQTLRNEVEENKIVQLHQVDELFDEYGLGSDSALRLYLNKEIGKVIRSKTIIAESGLRIGGGSNIISTWDATLTQLIKRNPKSELWAEVQDYYPDWVKEFFAGFRTFYDGKGETPSFRITKGTPRAYIDTSMTYADLGFDEFKVEQLTTTERLTEVVDYALDVVLGNTDATEDDESKWKPVEVVVTTDDDTEILVSRNIAGDWVGTILI